MRDIKDEILDELYYSKHIIQSLSYNECLDLTDSLMVKIVDMLKMVRVELDDEKSRDIVTKYIQECSK